MHGRLTSTYLVGRATELAELQQAFEQAASGRPGVVLIGGDSGIGKTRLLTELERRVSDGERPALVLRGEAVQAGDGELPYGPLLGALRPLVRGRHEVLNELAPGSRAPLAALLPGLGESTGRVEREDPATQVRLFESLLELLDRLSDHQPVVLILEDMHWSDRSTRAFVAYLARSVRRERLLVLLSYRSDELTRRHPLRPLLAELERLERVWRLQLSPFDRGELAEALADILGAPASGELVERLHARAEGNPLFTEELLAASLDGRGVAPQSLRDAFMLRIERLSPEAQRAVRVIAVGRSLPEPVIAEVSGLSHEALQEALREAVAAQVLVPRGEDCLSLRHELLREALYEDLLPGERSELHLALAELYERRLAEGEESGLEVAASIASHYGAAGCQPAALRTSIAAALSARSVHAAAEAARLAERGLELWSRVPDPEQVAGISHVRLTLLAARSLLDAAAPTRAEHLLRAELDRLDAEAEPLTAACVLGVLARTQWSLNRGLEGVRTAKRALALLPDDGAEEERIDLLGWLARTELLRGRLRDAARDGGEALLAARAAGDYANEADALNTLGMAQAALGDVEGGTALLREAIVVATERDDLDRASHARANLADTLAVAGRTREGLAVAREGLRTVPRHLRSSYDWMAMTLSELAYLHGEWKLARRHLGPPPSELLGRGLIFRLLREAELALGEGDELVAVRALDDAQPLVATATEPQWIGAYGALRAELHRRRRELLEARAAVAEGLDRIELCCDDVVRISRVSAMGVGVEAQIAQRARDLGERAEERDALARARLHMQRLKAAADEGGPVEAAWLAHGTAELAVARGRPAAALWVKAAEKWEAVERPYAVAVACWRAAEAAAIEGDRDMAATQAARARELATEVGSRWLSTEVQGLITRARLVLSRSEEDTVAEAAPQEDPFGLTPREREVLGLIAEGATNRQIGNVLFMAEKTASVHVSRILAKLGVHSRTEAAAVAHRLGLAGSAAAGALAPARPR